MDSLEVALLAMVGSGRYTADECARKLRIPELAAHSIFNLWSERGWYEWQDRLIGDGWLTPNGQEALARYAEMAA